MANPSRPNGGAKDGQPDLMRRLRLEDSSQLHSQGRRHRGEAGSRIDLDKPLGDALQTAPAAKSQTGVLDLMRRKRSRRHRIKPAGYVGHDLARLIDDHEKESAGLLENNIGKDAPAAAKSNMTFQNNIFAQRLILMKIDEPQQEAIQAAAASDKTASDLESPKQSSPDDDSGCVCIDQPAVRVLRDLLRRCVALGVAPIFQDQRECSQLIATELITRRDELIGHLRLSMWIHIGQEWWAPDLDAYLNMDEIPTGLRLQRKIPWKLQVPQLQKGYEYLSGDVAKVDSVRKLQEDECYEHQIRCAEDACQGSV